jgi:hypothetical protein
MFRRRTYMFSYICQTQDIHYSENKASDKAVELTYPYVVVIP